MNLDETTNPFRHIGIGTCVLLGVLGYLWHPLPAFPQAASTPSAISTPRDGQHDFDFQFGKWRTHISRLARSGAWVKYEGTVVVSKVWNGRAGLEEIEADGPSHWESLLLRLYDPESHQWSLNFATSSGGTLSVPMVGEFTNGQGEFYDQEPVNGRVVLVRSIWSDITPNSYHFEQAYSDDDGKTWKPNFVASLTRELQ